MATGVLLNGETLLGTPAIIGTRDPMAWRPPTLLGINITEPFIETLSVDPGQMAVFKPLGISYVRGSIQVYQYGSYDHTYAQPAIWNISHVQPYASDPTQLQFTVDYCNYVPQGEPLILAKPVKYQFANGATLTLPAQTIMTCTGGTPGTWDRYGKPITYATVRVAAGGELASNGVQSVSATQMVHRNYYLSGSIPRLPVPSYLDKINQWIAAGFWFDYTNGLPDWQHFAASFGQSAADYMRAQEMAYIAGQNFSPAKVFISDGPEPQDLTGTDYPAKLWNNFLPQFQALYSGLRSYFPDHSLGFSFPNYGGLAPVPYATWWPNDKNTLARVHCYPDAGSFPQDCIDPVALGRYMDFLAANAKNAGIPELYFQEFGLKMNEPDAQARLANFRRAILGKGWKGCLWAASQFFPTPGDYDVCHKINADLSGPWVPVPGITGAFGLS